MNWSLCAFSPFFVSHLLQTPLLFEKDSGWRFPCKMIKGSHEEATEYRIQRTEWEEKRTTWVPSPILIDHLLSSLSLPSHTFSSEKLPFYPGATGQGKSSFLCDNLWLIRESPSVLLVSPNNSSDFLEFLFFVKFVTSTTRNVDIIIFDCRLALLNQELDDWEVAMARSPVKRCPPKIVFLVDVGGLLFHQVFDSCKMTLLTGCENISFDICLLFHRYASGITNQLAWVRVERLGDHFAGLISLCPTWATEIKEHFSLVVLDQQNSTSWV